MPCQVVRRLPVVTVNLKAPKIGVHSDQSAKSRTSEHISKTEGMCVLEIGIQCRRGGKKHNGGTTAFAPRFPKLKDEAWWLVVGDIQNQELLALKRLTILDDKKTVARLKYPANRGLSSGQSIHLFLMSDCYIGLDQQYEVPAPE